MRNKLMKKIILLLFIAITPLAAQTEYMFVDYGPKASEHEGDDNAMQVINIQLPQNYEGNAYLRLFDMSCGSSIDIIVGNWNSHFRFSLFKNELTEETYRSLASYSTDIKEIHLSHFESGYDPRYFNKWYTWYDIGGEGKGLSLKVFRGTTEMNSVFSSVPIHSTTFQLIMLRYIRINLLYL